MTHPAYCNCEPCQNIRRAQNGRKDDGGKPRWATLLPWAALDQVVRVLEHGAARYGSGNWRQVPEATSRYLDAALRHVVARLRGERLDPDSGLPHLAHAACCLLFLLELDQ